MHIAFHVFLCIIQLMSLAKKKKNNKESKDSFKIHVEVLNNS